VPFVLAPEIGAFRSSSTCRERRFSDALAGLG